MSLDTLAEKTGINKPSLSRLENDPSPNVTLTTLHRVATALGYDLHIAVVPSSFALPPTKRATRVTPKRPTSPSKPTDR